MPTRSRDSHHRKSSRRQGRYGPQIRGVETLVSPGAPGGSSQRSAGHEAPAVAERHGGSRFPILSCTKTAQTDSGPPLGPQAKTRAVELAGPSTEQLHTCIWVKPVAAPSPDGRAVACERGRDGDRRPLPYPSRSVSARPVSSPPP